MRIAPLRNRSFRLLLVGQGASAVGDGIAPVALAFAVLDLTGSVGDLGLVLAAQSVPLLVFVLLGGVWSDRVSRGSVMLCSDLVRAGVQGGSAALLLTGAAGVWQLAALQALYGAARAFFGPAATGLVPETVDSDQLQQANGLMGVAENLARIVGPALGGVVVVAAGAGWGLACDGAAFLVSAVSLRMMRLAPLGPPERRGTLAELREGWRAFQSRTWLWVSVVSLTLIITVVFAPLYVLGPEVARAHLGGAGAWAAISTASGIGATVGGAVALRWWPRHPLRTGFLLTLAGEPVLLFLLAGPGPLAPIIVFSLVSGMAATIFNVYWFTALQREVPQAELSRVSSWDQLGSYGLQPIGLVAVGPIAVAVGISTTLYAAGVLVLLLTGVVLSMPAVRNFTSPSARPPEPATDAS
ncbi:MAG TPA: MFS transporter [Solirubrobacteraceae bacterium]|nr:MFS transporter [Solirubrobacteraceae bacterium]